MSKLQREILTEIRGAPSYVQLGCVFSQGASGTGPAVKSNMPRARTTLE